MKFMRLLKNGLANDFSLCFLRHFIIFVKYRCDNSRDIFKTEIARGTYYFDHAVTLTNKLTYPCVICEIL